MSARKEALKKLRDRYRAEILDCVNQVNDKLNSPNKSTKSALNYDECLPKKLSEIAKALSATKVLSHSVHLATAAALGQELYIHRLTSNRKQIGLNASASLINAPTIDPSSTQPDLGQTTHIEPITSGMGSSSHTNVSSDSRAVAKALLCPKTTMIKMEENPPAETFHMNLAETAAAAFARRTAQKVQTNPQPTSIVPPPPSSEQLETRLPLSTASDFEPNVSTHTSEDEIEDEQVPFAADSETQEDNVSSLSMSDSTTPVPLPPNPPKDPLLPTQDEEETPLSQKELKAARLQPVQPVGQPAPIGVSATSLGASLVQENEFPSLFAPSNLPTIHAPGQIVAPKFPLQAAGEKNLQGNRSGLIPPMMYAAPNKEPTLFGPQAAEAKQLPRLDLSLLKVEQAAENNKQHSKGTGNVGVPLNSSTVSDVTMPTAVFKGKSRQQPIYGIPLECADGVPSTQAVASHPLDQPWLDPNARISSATQTEQSCTAQSFTAQSFTTQTYNPPDRFVYRVNYPPPPELSSRIAGLISAPIPPPPPMAMPPPPPRLIAAAPPIQRALLQQTMHSTTNLSNRQLGAYNSPAPRSVPLGTYAGPNQHLSFRTAGSYRQFQPTATQPIPFINQQQQQAFPMRRSPLISEDVQKLISSRVHARPAFIGEVMIHGRGNSLTLPIASKR